MIYRSISISILGTNFAQAKLNMLIQASREQSLHTGPNKSSPSFFTGQVSYDGRCKVSLLSGSVT